MVKYRDTYLARNSEAYEMWERKDFKALDKHLKNLEQKERDLIARYEKKERPAS